MNIILYFLKAFIFCLFINPALASDKVKIINEIKALDNKLYETHGFSFGFSNKYCDCSPHKFYDDTPIYNLVVYKTHISFFIDSYTGGKTNEIDAYLIDSYSIMYSLSKEGAELELVKGIINYFQQTYGVFTMLAKNSDVCKR